MLYSLASLTAFTLIWGLAGARPNPTVVDVEARSSAGKGTWISLLNDEDTCLAQISNGTDGSSEGGTLGLRPCNESNSWSVLLNDFSMGIWQLYGQSWAVVPRPVDGSTDAGPSTLNLTAYIDDVSVRANYSWEATNSSQITYPMWNTNGSSYCVNGDKDSGAVTLATCQNVDSQKWNWRGTPEVVSASNITESAVFQDPKSSSRIRGLGRDDLCVMAEAAPGANGYNGTLYPGLDGVLAHCVSNDADIAGFQLFSINFPSNFPTSNYTGPITFISSPVQFDTTKSYCLDAGSSASDGSSVVVQVCDASQSGQQWIISNSTIVLKDSPLCLDATKGSGSLQGQGDYQPEYALQVFTCTENDSRQVFSFYTGNDVPLAGSSGSTSAVPSSTSMSASSTSVGVNSSQLPASSTSAAISSTSTAASSVSAPASSTSASAAASSAAQR